MQSAITSTLTAALISSTTAATDLRLDILPDEELEFPDSPAAGSWSCCNAPTCEGSERVWTDWRWHEPTWYRYYAWYMTTAKRTFYTQPCEGNWLSANCVQGKHASPKGWCFSSRSDGYGDAEDKQLSWISWQNWFHLNHTVSRPGVYQRETKDHVGD